jgi:hypothetical protein
MRWASSGVSPSAAGRGEARCGEAGSGWAGSGWAWAAMAARRAFGLSLPPSLVDRAGHAGAWRSATASGWSWRGRAGHGLQTAARRVPTLPAALLGGRGKAKQATVWQGAAGCGAVRPGGPWAADGSAEGFNPPRRPLGWTWQGAARSGPARSGGVRLGMPRRGRLRHGLTISALSPSGLSAGFFGIQMWLGMLRRARARSGKAAQTPARHVPARVTDGGTEGSIPPCHSHKGGLGKAGLNTARRGQA